MVVAQPAGDGRRDGAQHAVEAERIQDAIGTPASEVYHLGYIQQQHLVLLLA